MASFETFNLCDLREYFATEEQRITAAERLVEGALFLSAHALAGVVQGRGAAKAPVIINKSERIQTATYEVDFSVLDKKSRVICLGVGIFDDGFIAGTDLAVRCNKTGAVVDVAQTYFLDHRKPIDGRRAISAGETAEEVVDDIGVRTLVTV